MKKITSRDLKFFLLGMLAMLLITIALEWRDFVDGFNHGMKAYK